MFRIGAIGWVSMRGVLPEMGPAYHRKNIYAQTFRALR
jgi:hypothetical protein